MNQNPIKKEQSKQIVISEDNAGQRIDNFLIRYLGKIPKSRIYQMLRKGEVRVNRGRIKQTYKLNEGDILRIPPIFTDVQKSVTPARFLQQKILDSVIYEDDSLIIINKPSGLAVHGGSGQEFGIIEIIRSLGEPFDKLELVHRLDKETSGCLVLAKDIPSLRKMHNAIKAGEMSKIYNALLSGKLDKKEYVIDKPLQKNTLQSGERLVKIDESGKMAITKFYRERIFDIATLARIELITGRTHQIRVHSAYMGHPVAGDRKYGNRDTNQEFKTRGLKRIFLHAKSLKFISPATNKLISVDAPLEQELIELLNKLAIKTDNISI